MKSYTDIEQSKQLAEILPIESADMFYLKIPNSSEVGYNYSDLPYFASLGLKDNLPCWSLAALLERLDDEITDEDGNDYNLTIVKEGWQYQLYYHDKWYEAGDIETDWYDDMIDACVEMIVKLHKEGIL